MCESASVGALDNIAVGQVAVRWGTLVCVEVDDF